MATFSPFDIVKVPFPYTDRPVRERRPALVISTTKIQEEQGLVWVLMITSAKNQGWTGDLTVTDLRVAGLPSASVVRTSKITTVEAKEISKLGELPFDDRAAVSRFVRGIVGV